MGARAEACREEQDDRYTHAFHHATPNYSKILLRSSTLRRTCCAPSPLPRNPTVRAPLLLDGQHVNEAGLDEPRGVP
eukprot:6198093-Pleurochrysis_carterae.AAC.1